MPASYSSSWIVSVKIALISTGVLSVAAALKFSVPVIADFVSSEVPSLWTFLLSWLEPPYIYVLINFIIAGIVASSKLHNKSDEAPPNIAGKYRYDYDGGGEEQIAPKIATESKVEAGNYRFEYGGGGAEELAPKISEAEISYGQSKVEAVIEPERDGVEEESLVKLNNRNLQRKDSVDFSGVLNEREKPPISARFAVKKSLKSTPEGAKSLGVSKKARKQDTLENTWKTITEGRAMPLARHLKKSDTFESHARAKPLLQNDENTPPPQRAMKKSETFHDGDGQSESPAKVRREASLSQDELNRRVEAFIRKFNEEMRMQRQESLNQYHEMIRSGGK